MISIRRKNVIAIGTIVALFFALIITYVAVIFRNNQIELANQNLKLICKDAAVAINSKNQRAILLAQTMAEYQESGEFGHRQENLDFAKSIIQNNDFLTGVYFGFEPNADGQDRQNIGRSPGYDQSGRFLPYWYRKNGLILLKPLVDMNSDYYMGPKKTTAMTITEPYLYQGVMLLSVTTPLIIHGEFCGIAGVDLAAEYLSMNLLNYKEYYQTSQIFLISDEGNIIAAGDRNLIGQPIAIHQDAAAAYQKIHQDTLPGVLELEGRPDRVFAFAPIENGHWTVLISVAKTEIVAQADALTYHLIIILLNALLILLITLFLSEKVIAKPLMEITRIINKMANIDFAFDEAKDITVFENRSDEVGEIARATKTMRTNISRLIDELQDNENNYRTLVANVPGVVFRASDDAAQTTFFVSEGIETLTGYPASDFIANKKRSYASIIHPEDLADFDANINQAVHDHRQYTIMYRIICAGGGIKWVQSRGQSIYDSDGSLLYIDGVIIDMTQQVLTMAALRESTTTLDAVFESITDGIVVIKPDLTIVHANQTMKNLFRQQLSPEINTCYQAYSQQAQPCDDCAALRCIQTGQQIKVDSTRLVGTELHWFESDYFPIIDDASGDNSGVVCLVRDITERKLTEEKLAYQSNLLEIVNDAIIAFDPEYKVTFWNHGAETMYGWLSGEAVGSRLTSLFRTVMSDQERSSVDASLLRGQTVQGEFIQHRRDGSPFWVELSCYAVYARDGQLKSFVSLNRDITAKKQMDKELTRMDQLGLVGRMAASIGHEIRNPMTSVRGFLQLLSEKPDCRAYLDYFELMISELDRANEIITHFLSLASNKPVQMRMNSLNRIIKKISPLINSDAILANLQFELELTEIPDFPLDENEISQLILNLSRNGLEAMPDQGLLKIKTRLAGSFVELIISDQGTGIPLALLEKLGTPFQTTKEQGTGLGLPVCFSIAHRHHAKIDVVTNGHGTTFTVRFEIPACPADSASISSLA